jgi:hypothetical protein
MAEAPSRGPRGYPDFQRVENWDGPEFVPLTSPVIPELKPFATGYVDCSRYSATALQIEVFLGTVKCEVEWSSEPGFTGRIGAKTWRMAFGTGGSGYLRLTNLGPFVNLIIHSVGAEAAVHLHAIFTNRVPTQEAIPVSEQILKNTSVYKAGETKIIGVEELATGTAHVILSGFAGTACNVSTVGINLAGEERFLGFTNFVTGIGPLPTLGEFHLPLQPWYAKIQNGPGEQEIAFQVLVSP